MKAYFYEGGGDFGEECAGIAFYAGFDLADHPHEAAVAIAPLLRRRLTPNEWAAPFYGTLIFHPSALPYRRGPDAIKQTIAAGERVSGVTWFWCAAALDAGDICEQELVVLLPGERPRDAYVNRFQPAGLRALLRALEGIRRDHPRRIPQDERLATYESFLKQAG